MSEPTERQKEFIRNAEALALAKYGDPEDVEGFMDHPHIASLGPLSPRDMIMQSDEGALEVLDYLMRTKGSWSWNAAPTLAR